MNISDSKFTTQNVEFLGKNMLFNEKITENCKKKKIYKFFIKIHISDIFLTVLFWELVKCTTVY